MNSDIVRSTYPTQYSTGSLWKKKNMQVVRIIMVTDLLSKKKEKKMVTDLLMQATNFWILSKTGVEHLFNY